jgi:N-acetylneuraminate synthase
MEHGMTDFRIGSHIIGEHRPIYYIADIAANHDGKLDRAFKLIELAKEAGAHAAKFQNFIASKIVSRKGFESMGNQLEHQAKWKKSVYEVYEDASISQDWTARLKEKCDEVGIEYFTSPYDIESVDHVDPLVRAYKIGSGDITWTGIIEHIASKGKPVILASGASSEEDVVRAMMVLRRYTEEICLMQCNTNYTAQQENFRFLNLNVLKRFKQIFPGTVLGLSDHTLGHSSVVASIALGARVIEKHFTDDNNREGPDHKFAMNPQTWSEMVERGNEAFLALGDGIKRVEGNESKTVLLQRRSLRYMRDIPAGHILTKDDLFPLRPATEDGIPPYLLDDLIGKEIKIPVYADDPAKMEHFK